MNHIRIKKIAIFAVLIGLMAVTRSHHFDSLTHLPDASLAVFLIAGVLLPQLALPVLLLAAGAVLCGSFLCNPSRTYIPQLRLV